MDNSIQDSAKTNSSEKKIMETYDYNLQLLEATIRCFKDFLNPIKLKEKVIAKYTKYQPI